MGAREKKFRYEKIYVSLKEKIIQGIYPQGHFLPSESELSRQFDVDRSTIRRALSMLSADNLVKKEAGLGSRVIYEQEHTAVPIQQSAQSHGFVGFFVSKENLIDSECEQPYYSNLFYDLELQCRQKNLQVIYHTLENENDFELAIERTFFWGVIFVSSVPNNYINQAMERRIPFVVINSSYSKGTCIMCNHLEGAFLALEYLYQMGHSRIAIIRGEEGYISDSQKMAGCLSAAFQYNKELEPDFIIRGNWEYKSGYDCAKILFSKPSPPSAVFCFNDIMALGAIKALREMGHSIGETVSVMGFDNMRQLEFSEPDLTTIDCSVSQVAQLAIEYLLIIANQGITNIPHTILAPVKLKKGRTVALIS